MANLIDRDDVLELFHGNGLLLESTISHGTLRPDPAALKHRRAKNNDGLKS